MGEVAKRLHGTVSKTIMGLVPTVGSTPPSPQTSIERWQVNTCERYLYCTQFLVKSIVFHILAKVDGRYPEGVETNVSNIHVFLSNVFSQQFIRI
jgi:hypothetical protein